MDLVTFIEEILNGKLYIFLQWHEKKTDTLILKVMIYNMHCFRSKKAVITKVLYFLWKIIYDMSLTPKTVKASL